MADSAGVNNPAAAIPINPGITAANGFTSNLYNATNYQWRVGRRAEPRRRAWRAGSVAPFSLARPPSALPSYYNFSTAGSFTATNGSVFPYVAGAASYPGTRSTTSSGCKYASTELAAFASPAKRAAAYANVSAAFTAGYGAHQFQVLFRRARLARGWGLAFCCMDPPH